MLSNQLGLFGIVTTIPYQILYAFLSLSTYGPLFESNLAVMGGYAWILWANHHGRYASARNFAVSLVMLQLLAVTWYVGPGIGVHLFYFTIGAILPLLFERACASTITLFASANIGLFWLCDRDFMRAAPMLGLPAPVTTGLFVLSLVGAIALTCAFVLLFRMEIDAVEARLTDSNRKLARLSETDALTELPNRRAMEAFLDHWRDEHSCVGIILCDIDHFKSYNDYYGHARGDLVLQAISGILTRTMRQGVDLVARYGGEEFIILMPRATLGSTLDAAERLRVAVETMPLADRPRTMTTSAVTLSVGYSLFDPIEQADPEAAIEEADQALYRAKRGGRNRVVGRTAGLVPAEENRLPGI
ncbi:diguanylate cyclase [Salinisphaera sp. Q1T1-3]|uniref:diguanylate cyclase n=1 Tax=Salinisphaera sp. Q1T1-3 TaxID=2321229 RepID=UPI0011C42C35|nr:diguanylate cyclase [Salinisphaera sp. Q1T1-3]